MTQHVFLRERCSQPLGQREREELLERSAIGHEFLALTRRQPGEAVEEVFEDERVKVLFLFKLSLFGTVLHETFGTESPLGSLIRAFDLTTGYELCEGGSCECAPAPAPHRSLAVLLDVGDEGHQLLGLLAGGFPPEHHLQGDTDTDRVDGGG